MQSHKGDIFEQGAKTEFSLKGQNSVWKLVIKRYYFGNVDGLFATPVATPGAVFN